MNLYVVTGTTKGLGHALAARIAAGADNMLVTLARGRQAAVGTGLAIAVDVADVAALETACDRIERHIEGQAFDKAVLINNAGVVDPVGPLERVEGRELARNLQVNLIAPMVLMGRFLRATAGVPLRRVINISSGAGRRPIAGWGGYCAAKAGLDMASRVAALEAQSRGQQVHVVSLAPGVIDTPMQAVVRGVSAEDFADVGRFRKMKEEGALRPPDDVAADILRLEAAGRLQGDAVLDLRELAQ